ncbi:FecR family protein [Treponema primitia]|uniref:FecR family protein n=1 Tax=Treponema primitia TaxID=88058 RepID=UPI0002554D8C|nr:FecR domain-containing protein [Treponema primitia]
MKQGIAGLWFLCVIAGLWAQNGGESRGYIRELTGNVEIKQPGADWIPAVEGQTLEQASMISTGFKGTALIALGNSVLTVKPLTRLTLQEIQEIAGNEKVTLTMQTGRIQATVNPPSGGKTDFAVRAPSVTASVRGTDFEFDGTSLKVSDGRVHLTGGDNTAVYVGAGQQVTTDPITGRTPIVAVIVREEITPSIPAGVTRTEAEAPKTEAPSLGSLILGTKW